jgi:hypothetical protein
VQDCCLIFAPAALGLCSDVQPSACERALNSKKNYVLAHYLKLCIMYYLILCTNICHVTSEKGKGLIYTVVES